MLALLINGPERSYRIDGLYYIEYLQYRQQSIHAQMTSEGRGPKDPAPAQEEARFSRSRSSQRLVNAIASNVPGTKTFTRCPLSLVSPGQSPPIDGTLAPPVKLHYRPERGRTKGLEATGGGARAPRRESSPREVFAWQTSSSRSRVLRRGAWGWRGAGVGLARGWRGAGEGEGAAG
jgi:hypothetical protein